MMNKHSTKRWKAATALISFILAVIAFTWPAGEMANRVYAAEGEHFFSWSEDVTDFTYSANWFYVLNNLPSEWSFVLKPKKTIDSPDGYLTFAMAGNDAALFEVTFEGASEWVDGGFSYHLALNESLEDLSPGHYTATLNVYEDSAGGASFDEANPAWAIPVSLTVEPGEENEQPGGWDDTHTYYYNDDGTAKTGWLEETTEYAGSTYISWYYLDPENSCAAATGWKKIGSYWYYFNPGFENGEGKGQMYQAGPAWIDGKTYFLDRDSGRMRTGWIKDPYGEDGEYTDWYYADANGVLQQGWRRIGGKWYYFDRGDNYGLGGWMYQNDVYDIYGKLYGFDKNGVLQYGWMKIARPVVAGPGQHGVYSFWAYADASGVVQTGWKKISGSWYFFDEQGAMRTNKWIKYSKGWCYVGSNGKMASNRWAKDSVGWTWLNANGRITKSKWVNYKGGWYYLDANGYMVTGTRTIGGKTYRFDSSGRML